jgi:hypothetical protein
MPHFAFVTSAIFGAMLGGTSGADTKCQAAADSGSVAGKLGLKWRALLSTSGVSAKSSSRMQILAPIYSLKSDGTSVFVANGSADLWDGSIGNFLNIDENGAELDGGQSFWTGTDANGNKNSYAGDYCQDWTVSSADTTAIGSTGRTNTEWILNSGLCSQSRRLLCVSVEDDI